MKLKYIIVLNIFIVFFKCTNPFTTRDADEPDQGSANYQPANNPDITLENFILAVEDKNTSQYMNTMIKPELGGPHRFWFEPEPSLKNNFNGPWLLQDESAYFDNLTKSKKAGFPLLSLTMESPLLTPITPISVDDSVESNNLAYNLRVDYGDSVKVYQGTMRFKLFHAETPPYWYIYYWSDNALTQDDRNSSWTYLKLNP